MSTIMTREEREAFLAGVHVGVLSLNQEGGGPLTTPVWYAYKPGGEVQIITERASRKRRAERNAAIERHAGEDLARRASLVSSFRDRGVAVLYFPPWRRISGAPIPPPLRFAPAFDAFSIGGPNGTK
jgi:hypothetical protein